MNRPDFEYIFQAASRPTARHLLLLHGTGGDENDLLPLGGQLLPDAALLSLRGRVLERGAPRFFRRFAEGVLDVEDWKFRTRELADFLTLADDRHELPATSRVAVGYSNGANIALGLLLLRPESLAAAVLFRPMFVSDDIPDADLSGKKILILSGLQDPLRSPEDPDRIIRQLQARGAQVASQLVPAGHGLIPNDLSFAKDWLASLD